MEVRRAEVYAQYGEIPPDDFDRLRDELPEIRPEDHRTFREDYEFYGAEKGTIHASYGGHCSECGLGIDFEVEKEFYSPPPPPSPENEPSSP